MIIYTHNYVNKVYIIHIFLVFPSLIYIYWYFWHFHALYINAGTLYEEWLEKIIAQQTIHLFSYRKDTKLRFFLQLYPNFGDTFFDLFIYIMSIKKILQAERNIRSKIVVLLFTLGCFACCYLLLVYLTLNIFPWESYWHQISRICQMKCPLKRHLKRCKISNNIVDGI